MIRIFLLFFFICSRASAQVTIVDPTKTSERVIVNTSIVESWFNGYLEQPADPIFKYETFSSPDVQTISATNPIGAGWISSSSYFTVGIGDTISMSFDLVLNSGTAPRVYLMDNFLTVRSNIYSSSSGANSFVLTSTYSGNVVLAIDNYSVADWDMTNITTSGAGLSGSKKTIIPYSPLYTDPILAVANHRMPGYDRRLPLMTVRRETTGDEVDIYEFEQGTSNYSILPNGDFTEDGSSENHYVITWYDQKGTPGAELINNGDMELDSAWSNRYITGFLSQSRSSEQAHTGIYSRKVITDYPNNGSNQLKAGILASRVYKVSGWIYNASSTPAALFAWNSTDGYTYSRLVSNSPYWQHVNLIYRPSVGGNQYFGSVKVGDTGTTTTWYFDDFSLKLVESHDVFQTTASLQPQLLFNQSNGWPVVSWDGSDDHLVALDDPDLNFGTSTNYSLSARIYPINFSDGRTIWSKDHGSPLWYFEINDGTATPLAGQYMPAVLNNIGTNYLVDYSTEIASSASWQFAALVAYRISNKFRFFSGSSELTRNVLLQSGAKLETDVDTTWDVYLGRNWRLVDNFYGNMSSAFIHRKALTPLEISDLNSYLENY